MKDSQKASNICVAILEWLNNHPELKGTPVYVQMIAIRTENYNKYYEAIAQGN